MLQLLSDDKTQSQIAHESYRSIHTVKGHLRSAKKKTGIHTTHGLIAWALRNDVIE